jgi:hypothetical protein
MRWTNPRIIDPTTLAATSSTRAAAIKDLNECVADKSTATSKNLTRRANHRHIDSIASIEPAPGNRPRAF